MRYIWAHFRRNGCGAGRFDLHRINQGVVGHECAPRLGISAAEPGLKIFSASDPKHLMPAGRIPLTGSAEGYAEDRQHGFFYTNLEEPGQTVAIDTRAHKVVSTWKSCEDPSGVAVDAKRGFVFVACTDHVIVLDTKHG